MTEDTNYIVRINKNPTLIWVKFLLFQSTSADSTVLLFIFKKWRNCVENLGHFYNSTAWSSDNNPWIHLLHGGVPVPYTDSKQTPAAHLRLKVHVEDPVRFIHDQELQSS